MAEFGSGNLKFVESSSLDAFSEALRFLHFDKAKDFIEKELEQNKSVLSQNWRAFLNACSELCSLEKSYYSLAYLQAKAPLFGRKENAREGYRALAAEFHRVSRASSAKLVSHVSDQLVEFVRARLDLMDLYAALCSSRLPTASYAAAASSAAAASATPPSPSSQQQQQQHLLHTLQTRELLPSDVVLITQKYRGKFHHPKLAGISTCFEDETEILFHLLNASGRINNLYFLESVMSLHEVNSRLAAWQDQSIRYKLHKGSQPNLLLWFHKFYSFLLSKYTLCFYNVLVQQAKSQQEVMRLSQQRSESDDLLTRLVHLHKRADCLMVLLVFNATAQSEPFLGHGYYLPGLIGDRPVGKDGYPVIFSYPTDSNPSQGDMTNILMTIASESWIPGGGAESAASSSSTSAAAGAGAASSARAMCFSDDKLRRAYCVGFAEPRIFLVLVLDRARAQKDRVLEKLTQEFCAQLAGCGLYGQLRTGGK